MNIIEVKSNWKDSDLRIEFMMGNLCNYSCWYCFPGSFEGTHRFPEFDLIVQNLMHLVQHYKASGKKRIFLHIIGGEPTLWPKLGEFAEIFSNAGCLISISTNASRTIRWWEENAKFFDKVVVSYHHERVDIEHNMKVCDILYRNGAIVNANVLMDPGAWDKCVAMVEKLKTSEFRWSILAAEVLHPTIQYTDEQKEYLKGYTKRMPNLWHYFRKNKHARVAIKVVMEDGSTKKVNNNWITLNKLNSFKGWSCNLGQDSLFITKEGNVTGTCNENLYGLDFRYNIYDPDFTDKFNPVIKPVNCSKELCLCQAEVNLRKKIND